MYIYPLIQLCYLSLSLSLYIYIYIYTHLSISLSLSLSMYIYIYIYIYIYTYYSRPPSPAARRRLETNQSGALLCGGGGAAESRPRLLNFSRAKVCPPLAITSSSSALSGPRATCVGLLGCLICLGRCVWFQGRASAPGHRGSLAPLR